VERGKRNLGVLIFNLDEKWRQRNWLPPLPVLVVFAGARVDESLIELVCFRLPRGVIPMARLNIDNLHKSFSLVIPGCLKALSFGTIEPGEFCRVAWSPSGCGNRRILRNVSGI